jgi:hypothetical protein
MRAATELPYYRYAGPIQESRRVTIAKISGQGLMSIALLVALLWACVIGERIVAVRASTGAAETLRAMRALRTRNRREPAAVPARPCARRPRPKLG